MSETSTRSHHDRGASELMEAALGRATAVEILAEAEADARANGHSPRGFLSRSCGFLPIVPPLVALPASHQAWDEASAILPELVAAQQVRRTLDALPRLSASADALGEASLWRASLLLGFLAHAYAHTFEAAAPLPACITEPWAEVNRRLGRPEPGLAMAEYATYNWTLKDKGGERSVENIDLLVYWFGNRAEHFWTTGIIEMHARSGPMVDAAANLQGAVLERDAQRAKVELARIHDALHAITYRAFLKIDPNPHSATHVDQLLWTKTWARFTAAVNPHERGLGGSGAPIIQLLDALFERGSFATEFAHETQRLGEWLPPYQRAFLDSFRRAPLSKLVREAGDRELQGLYHGALEAYAGPRGFLGVHRLKVYGYMEVGFAAGRATTNSGFSGDPTKRAWDNLDDIMEETRLERYAGKAPAHCPMGRRGALEPATSNPRAAVKLVALDIENEGIRYVSGDRLGILPQSNPELVQKTLRALGAEGNEPIRLTSAWRTALKSFSLDAEGTIPLRELLSYARLRPLSRAAGKLLVRLSGSKGLHQLLEKRQEDQIELWDALELLTEENYDVRRLWRAAPWEAESITRILSPERTRIYSISSAPVRKDGEASPREIQLTVGRLAFESKVSPDRPGHAREGTGSGHLVREHGRALPIPIQIIHPSRFSLPDDPERPIVMFGGGTGIAPFRGFLQQRAADPRSGPNLLLLGARTMADVPYERELRAWVEQGKLDVRAAFSRDPQRISSDGGEVRLVSGAAGYIDALFDDEATGDLLWRCLQSRAEGGLDGYFYICGQAGFAHTVINAVVALVARRLPGEHPKKEAALFFRKLMAQGRFMLDVFTTFAPSSAASVLGFASYDASEVILHNNEGQGHWIVLQGLVYDTSEFMHIHPGGEKLLVTNAGMDGTRSYEKCEHHLNPEVHALLDLYKIGFIRRLDFGQRWGIAVKPRGSAQKEPSQRRDAGALEYLSLHDFYRRWMRFVYKIVGLENALNNNLSLRASPIVRNDDASETNKLRARLMLETHTIFHESLNEALGAELEMVWCLAVGFCSHDRSITALTRALSAVRSSDRARAARSLAEGISTRLEGLAPTHADDPDGFARLERDLGALERCDLALIAAIKASLREGLLAFEAHEEHVVERGGDALVRALEAVPAALERYHDDVSESLRLKHAASA